MSEEKSTMEAAQHMNKSCYCQKNEKRNLETIYKKKIAEYERHKQGLEEDTWCDNDDDDAGTTNSNDEVLFERITVRERVEKIMKAANLDHLKTEEVTNKTRRWRSRRNSSIELRANRKKKLFKYQRTKCIECM